MVGIWEHSYSEFIYYAVYFLLTSSNSYCKIAQTGHRFDTTLNKFVECLSHTAYINYMVDYKIYWWIPFVQSFKQEQNIE
jgi:hypothetical protein